MKKPDMGGTPNTSVGGMNNNPIQTGPGLAAMNSGPGPMGMNPNPQMGMNNMRGSTGPGNNMYNSNMYNMKGPSNSSGNLGGMGGMAPMVNNKGPLNSLPENGGFQWRKPDSTPNLVFNEYVNKTPDNMPNRYYIPWDHVQSNFVYAAADPNVFKGAMTMRAFQSVSL
jgi:hypothetical protein